MISRSFWTNRIEVAWQEAPIVWLAGVRRVGKTTLAQSLGQERISYINCDLPVTHDIVADPELFYRNCTHPVVVFDEIHQLHDPSTVLKIGADLFPHLKIMATGSSTIAASKKFRDTLTGRKRRVHLTPVLWDELSVFENTPLLKRLYHGGLPQALLNATKQSGFYREWIDSFFARDIQKLFAFRNYDKFTLFFEYVMRQSGGQLETSKAASALSIGRPTVESHMRALEITHAATIVRPFFGGGRKEIVRMPKVYGFDTGFVSFCRGWEPLRPDDCGLLWEHLVLEYLQAHLPDQAVQYWRDADGREIDFIMIRKRDEVDAIECKWSPDHFNAEGLKIFRSFYNRGKNYLVCPLSGPGYRKRVAGMDIQVCTPEGLLKL
ncbi:MAG: ATP-binding protein [Deltaproteobacteria bacterium]|nr:ATP-binding protein [Deltaproteobacteria bacterium]